MTAEKDRERWRGRPALVLLPRGELEERAPLWLPHVGFPERGSFKLATGERLFLPSFKWFGCVECAYCELHIRRENVKDHLRTHDRTAERKLLRDDYKVGSHHKVHPKQQKLMV